MTCQSSHDEWEATCPDCGEAVDAYGNTPNDFRNCCFPDCGCDGARLCMAPSGASYCARNLNFEKRDPSLFPRSGWHAREGDGAMMDEDLPRRVPEDDGPPAPEGFPIGKVLSVAHDGFVGRIIGHYTTIEGKQGVVLQQVGTRVVHVYGTKWFERAQAAGAPAKEADHG